MVETIPADLKERLVALRRELHRRPELSNEEFETTARLRRELEEAGVEGVRPLGPTGLVVDITGDPDGPVVVVRGDIDALPIHEQTDLEFRSERDGVMHACGHDLHGTIAAGVAILAWRRRAELPGILRVILQPAEEAEPLGGREVVRNGHLEGVAAAVALHVDPEKPTGYVSLRKGPSMASSDEFAIAVQGTTSHAGWPHLGRDAVSAAAAVVQAVEQLVSRRLNPISPVTINLARIEGGAATNIVADSVRIEGTIRALDEEARRRVHEELPEVIAAAAASRGATATIEITKGEPSLVNHPAVIDAFAATVEERLGADRCVWLDAPTMVSEDFAFYSQEVPAALAWVGVKNPPDGESYPLHDPKFVADEEAIPIGVDLLLNTAIALQKDPPRA